MKKFIKVILATFLLIGGIGTIRNNVKAAEEEVLRVPNSTVSTYRIQADVADTTLTINYKLRRTNTGTGEILLGYDSFSSVYAADGSQVFLDRGVEYSGYSSNVDANQRLVITMYFRVNKSSTDQRIVKVVAEYKLNSSPTITTVG